MAMPLTTGREPRLNGVRPPSQPSTKALTVSSESSPDSRSWLSNALYACAALYSPAIILETTSCEEVGVVNGTRLVAGGEIHQAVLQRLCVMERKLAAGDHIRQPTVFIEEFVEIQIVVSHHKFHVHVRELGLNVGGVLFLQVRRPQIHPDGFPSSSAVLPAQPARRETLIASVSSSAAIRLHVLSFIGHCPFKKIGSTRLFLSSKKHLQDVEHPHPKVFCAQYIRFWTPQVRREVSAQL